jgi:uncharacterized metal-binding protein YceD (DUF177 family)
VPKEEFKILNYDSKIDMSVLETENRIKFELFFSKKDTFELKKFLNLKSIKKLSMAGTIKATLFNQWDLKAKIGATIVQESVLSLKLVTSRIDKTIKRSIIKGRDEMVETNELYLNDSDFVENEIDIGAIFSESLALEIPTFPKKENEVFKSKTFAGEGIAPLTEEKLSPFSVLAKLQENNPNE